LRGNRPLNRSLWGLQIVLGIYFMLVGVVHFVVPGGLPGLLSWMYELPDALHIISGTADILGGLGLILPGLSRIQPGLTVWAAAGLLIVMIPAAFWHLGRGELVNVLINLALVGLLGFLVYSRARRSPHGPLARQVGRLHRSQRRPDRGLGRLLLDDGADLREHAR
jgi:putative oxidoreductase